MHVFNHYSYYDKCGTCLVDVTASIHIMYMEHGKHTVIRYYMHLQKVMCLCILHECAYTFTKLL